MPPNGISCVLRRPRGRQAGRGQDTVDLALDWCLRPAGSPPLPPRLPGIPIAVPAPWVTIAADAQTQTTTSVPSAFFQVRGPAVNVGAHRPPPALACAPQRPCQL